MSTFFSTRRTLCVIIRPPMGSTHWLLLHTGVMVERVGNTMHGGKGIGGVRGWGTGHNFRVRGLVPQGVTSFRGGYDSLGQADLSRPEEAVEHYKGDSGLKGGQGVPALFLHRPITISNQLNTQQEDSAMDQDKPIVTLTMYDWTTGYPRFLMTEVSESPHQTDLLQAAEAMRVPLFRDKENGR